MTIPEDATEVVQFEFDVQTGKTRRFDSFIYQDEEPKCKYFHSFDNAGCINVCEGNEPYSCHRSKKEGLCHEKKG
jgi:hypothetical protein